jgi:hypothetical protein
MRLTYYTRQSLLAASSDARAIRKQARLLLTPGLHPDARQRQDAGQRLQRLAHDLLDLPLNDLSAVEFWGGHFLLGFHGSLYPRDFVD